jgi:SlyX protein
MGKGTGEGIMDTDLHTLQERIAHLTRAVEDLSDVVHSQSARLARLERTVEALVERALDTGPTDAPAANVRPPHW